MSWCTRATAHHRAHSTGSSQRRATPKPRGSRPALTRLAARNTSDSRDRLAGVALDARSGAARTATSGSRRSWRRSSGVTESFRAPLSRRPKYSALAHQVRTITASIRGAGRELIVDAGAEDAVGHARGQVGSDEDAGAGLRN